MKHIYKIGLSAAFNEEWKGKVISNLATLFGLTMIPLVFIIELCYYIKKPKTERLTEPQVKKNISVLKLEIEKLLTKNDPQLVEAKLKPLVTKKDQNKT